MDELHNKPAAEEQPKLRGLYKNVKISVRALDLIIVVCIAAILLVFAIEMLDPGYTVTFDSKGGSDVAPIHQEYGPLEALPEPPVREGYTFTGWYRDPACDLPWNNEADLVDTDLTLYAGWQKNG